jgi:cbb3-type cytochrome oxidase maturation protein
MTALAWLIPSALALGALGLVAFLWSLNSGQFDDLEGASWRALNDEVSSPPKRNETQP